jgi:outer membrane protein assembly factor BamB
MRQAIALLTLTVLLACHAAVADESDYFRRDSGVIRGKQALPDNFTDDADRVWRTELSPGISTPCVDGDSIFLTTWEPDKNELATVALDRVTGKIRWRNVVPTAEIEKVHSVGSPASSSPACNGKQVFAFFGSYGLLCYDLDGKLLREKKMGPFQDEFGASSSPVLAEGMVILNEDHDIDSFLIAIDQQTGQTVWKGIATPASSLGLRMLRSQCSPATEATSPRRT